MKNFFVLLSSTLLCVIFTFSLLNSGLMHMAAYRDVYIQQVSWERYLKNYWRIKLTQVVERQVAEDTKNFPNLEE